MRKNGIIIILALALLPAANSLAYNQNTTHPALTDEIVDFYNLSGVGRNISPEEKAWIVEGSILEDTPPRWINHFYDPVRKLGWTGDKAGNIPQSVVGVLSRIGLSTEAPLPAPDWVENYPIQQEYESYGGNRTWKRGVEYYTDGDKREAYRTLGYILHVLEDMSVPDHTRDDTHADPLYNITGDPGSPYELWADRWTPASIKSLGIANSLNVSGIRPPQLTTLRDYLVSVATYSNKYFFSRDTINDPKYEFPKIVREDENFGYGVDDIGKEFPLVMVDTQRDSAGNEVRTYSLRDRQEYYPILESYFSRLSRRAVLDGAGVVALFQAATKDVIENKEYPNRLVVLDPKYRNLFTFPNISFFGLIDKLSGYVNGAIDGAARFISGVIFPGLGDRSGALAIDTIQSAPAAPSVALNIESGQDISPPAAGAVEPPAVSPSTALGAGIVEPPSVGTTQAVSSTNQPALSAATAINTATSDMFIAARSSAIIYSGGGGGGGVSVAAAAAPLPQAETSTPPAGTSTIAEASSTVPEASSTASTAETPSSTLPSIGNFQAVFSTSTLAVDFSWDALVVASGATSTVTYAINDISSSTASAAGASTLIAETTSTSASWPVTAHNRSYTFSIQAFDSGAPVSATSSASVSVPDLPAPPTQQEWNCNGSNTVAYFRLNDSGLNECDTDWNLTPRDGNMGWTGGYFNDALEFTGYSTTTPNGWAHEGSAFSLQGRSWTISLLFKPNRDPQGLNDQTLWDNFLNTEADFTLLYQLRDGNAELLLRHFNYYTYTSYAYSLPGLLSHTWHNVIVTENTSAVSSSVSIYIDGVGSETTGYSDGGSLPGGSNFVLGGGGAYTNSDYWLPNSTQGTIDEVIVENKYWTAADVNDYYNHYFLVQL